MFFKLLGALLVADAVDRAAHARPQKYWYPDGTVSTHAQPPAHLTPPAPGPPANWYPDPWDPAALRWWDGTQWTAHTAQSELRALEA